MEILLLLFVLLSIFALRYLYREIKRIKNYIMTDKQQSIDFSMFDEYKVKK